MSVQSEISISTSSQSEISISMSSQSEISNFFCSNSDIIIYKNILDVIMQRKYKIYTKKGRKLVAYTIGHYC